MNPVLTEQDVAGLAEIVRLLDEAYSHYFDSDDGYGKPADGSVKVTFGTYLERSEGEPGAGVEICSYAFGPSGRQHTFGSVEEALAEVRAWHAEEMENDHTDPFAEWDGDDLPDLDDAAEELAAVPNTSSVLDDGADF